MSSSEPVNVRHNEPAHRFEAGPAEALSVADYVIEGDRIVFTHTYTPPAQRGRGIAEKLVRAGLEFARAQNLKVVPACSYVAAFVERHTEFKPLLA